MALKLGDPVRHRRVMGPLAARQLDAHLARLPVGTGPWVPLATMSGHHDAVVTVGAMCDDADLDATVARLRAAIPEGGELRFVEHVGRGDHRLTRLVDRGYSVLPLGCHVGHDVPGALRRGGFTVVDLERFSMPSAVPLLRHWVSGLAR